MTIQHVNIGRKVSLFTHSENKYYKREKKMETYQKKING